MTLECPTCMTRRAIGVERERGVAHPPASVLSRFKHGCRGRLSTSPSPPPFSFRGGCRLHRRLPRSPPPPAFLHRSAAVAVKMEDTCPCGKKLSEAPNAYALYSLTAGSQWDSITKAAGGCAHCVNRIFRSLSIALIGATSGTIPTLSTRNSTEGNFDGRAHVDGAGATPPPRKAQDHAAAECSECDDDVGHLVAPPLSTCAGPSSRRPGQSSRPSTTLSRGSTSSRDKNQEMKVVEHTSFTISSRALECHVCRLPPKPHHDGQHLYLCDAGHVVCGSCKPAHTMTCAGSVSIDCCRLLEDIGSRIEIKCACGVYVRYGKLKDHQGNCQPGSFCTSAWRKCKLRAALVRCSVCRAILRPPVFKQRAGVGLFCADCHNANLRKDMSVRCPDLEYLLKCVMVKTRRPYCIPGDEDETKTPLVGSSKAIA